MTLAYGGAKQNQSLPAVVDPAAKRVTMDTSQPEHKQIALTMGMGEHGWRRHGRRHERRLRGHQRHHVR